MGYEKGNGDSAGFSAPFPPVEDYIPDPKKHLYVSLAKSGVRIVGYGLMFGIPSWWAATEQLC